MAKTVTFVWKRGESFRETRRKLNLLRKELSGLFWQVAGSVLLIFAIGHVVVGMYRSFAGDVASSTNHLAISAVMFIVLIYSHVLDRERAERNRKQD